MNTRFTTSNKQSRSTIKVRELITKANDFFAADYGSRDGRKMLQSFVESFLHETGNYVGFQYLTVSQVPPGQPAGVIHASKPDETGYFPHEFPDDSRVYFYYSAKLKGDQ